MGSAPPTTWQPVGEPAAAPEVSLMVILGFPLLPPKPGAQGFGHTIPPISVISSYKAESPGAVLKSCPPCLSTFTAPSLLHPALLPEQGAGSYAHTSSVPLPNHPGATHPLVDPQSHRISPNPFLHPQTLLHGTEKCSHPPPCLPLANGVCVGTPPSSCPRRPARRQLFPVLPGVGEISSH